MIMHPATIYAFDPCRETRQRPSGRPKPTAHLPENAKGPQVLNQVPSASARRSQRRLARTRLAPPPPIRQHTPETPASTRPAQQSAAPSDANTGPCELDQLAPPHPPRVPPNPQQASKLQAQSAIGQRPAASKSSGPHGRHECVPCGPCCLPLKTSCRRS